jgi:hypothetical protein
MEDIPEDFPAIIKFSRQQLRTKSFQALGVIDLIAIHAENPGFSTGVCLNHHMGLPGVGDPGQLDGGIDFGQAGQDGVGLIRRAVVRHEQEITEIHAIPYDHFDMEIFVLHHEDPDDLVIRRSHNNPLEIRLPPRLGLASAGTPGSPGWMTTGGARPVGSFYPSPSTWSILLFSPQGCNDDRENGCLTAEAAIGMASTPRRGVARGV